MSDTPKTEEFSMTKSNFGTRGWIFVIYSFLVMVMTTFVGNSNSNLLLPSLCERYGWNYANMLFARTVFSWFTIVMFFFFGSVLRKFSPKKGAVICGILYTLATFFLPRSSLMAVYLICMFVLGVFGSMWYNQFNAIITSNWFPRKKGLVIGWTTMGLPLGAGLGTKIYYMLMPHIGPNGVYTLYSGIIFVTMLLCVIFVTDYPEQCGCFPDNDKSMTTEMAQKIMEEGIRLSEQSIWTNKRLVRTKEVWLLGIALGFQMMFTGGFMGVMVPRMMALGYDAGTAVNFMLFAAIMGAVGSYAVGIVDSKTNPKVAMIVVNLSCIASCILNIIPNRLCVIISLVLLGLVLGGAANCLMSAITTMWGRYSFRRAHTIILMINQIIGTAGSPVVAKIAEKFSWTGSYLFVGTLALIGLFLIFPIKLDSIKNYEIAEGVDLAVR